MASTATSYSSRSIPLEIGVARDLDARHGLDRQRLGPKVELQLADAGELA
jgi:hypothetical protein